MFFSEVCYLYALLELGGQTSWNCYLFHKCMGFMCLRIGKQILTEIIQ